MATARELLKILQEIPDKNLDIPLSMPGHYDEHHDVSLPKIRLVRRDWESRPSIFVLAFPIVDVGSEPD